jgi:hypothetical protein
MAEKYEGLFSCPASDDNFISALRGLSVEELESFKTELITRDLDEYCHKGRINAVAKEIRQRSSGSKDIVAVVKLKEEIQEADRLYLLTTWTGSTTRFRSSGSRRANRFWKSGNVLFW